MHVFFSIFLPRVRCSRFYRIRCQFRAQEIVRVVTEGGEGLSKSGSLKRNDPFPLCFRCSLSPSLTLLRVSLLFLSIPLEAARGSILSSQTDFLPTASLSFLASFSSFENEGHSPGLFLFDLVLPARTHAIGRN